MKDPFIKNVSEGDFSAARELVNRFSQEEMEEYLLELAYDTGSILPYSFVCTLLAERETTELHFSASLLMSQPLCHIQDGYKAALYHARNAVRLSPDDLSLKMYLLFFNHIPEKLISDQEALEIASDILKADPQNELAREQFYR